MCGRARGCGEVCEKGVNIGFISLHKLIRNPCSQNDEDYLVVAAREKCEAESRESFSNTTGEPRATLTQVSTEDECCSKSRHKMSHSEINSE